MNIINPDIMNIIKNNIGCSSLSLVTGLINASNSGYRRTHHTKDRKNGIMVIKERMTNILIAFRFSENRKNEIIHAGNNKINIVDNVLSTLFDVIPAIFSFKISGIISSSFTAIS